MISTIVRRGASEEADSLKALEQEGRHQRSLQEVFARPSVAVRHQIVRRGVRGVLVHARGLCAHPVLLHLSLLLLLRLLHGGDFLTSSRFLQFLPSDSSLG